MARLKGMLQSALQDRSPRFMLGTIALAVVVALIAGTGIGYKIEKSRVHPAKKVATHKPTKTTKGPKPVKFKIAPLLVGAVFAARPKQLVVVNANRKVFHIALGRATRVAEADPGKASSIVVGSKVVFQPTSSSTTTAAEVVVLPAKARLGTPVTSVVRGTSMTLKSLSGSGTVIRISGASVLTTGPGSAKSIAKGDNVLIEYVIAGGRHPASEIVLLPKGTKFK